ncbi:hypothetical protein BKA00_005130 [Actinomadura coerulea]|uniref:Uncharacterized protein n=1 Tax=Actinomadura coerulea TaxID=46159 RepID=A0A7X0G4K4_9ACTN|nr:hypothetical protein [Actinomadura coerulea]MBB6398216.1 hypothetical protein [Actinomadura coerulea]GGQ11292.1 hypothetical protein GCM10010187_29530 [Actinomadura coerulea]
MVIPQRERITFLVLLADVLAPCAGVVTAFAVIEGFAVLNVISMEPARRAVTVGCRYSGHGAWWLYYVHSGELIGPANDLAGAARQIRNQMEVAAAA